MTTVLMGVTMMMCAPLARIHQSPVVMRRERSP